MRLPSPISLICIAVLIIKPVAVADFVSDCETGRDDKGRGDMSTHFHDIDLARPFKFVIKARCKQWMPPNYIYTNMTETTIDINKCIANDNGKLVKRKDGGFISSCLKKHTYFGLVVDKGKKSVLFKAECKNAAGKWKKAQINLNDVVYPTQAKFGLECDPRRLAGVPAIPA
ncbi:hypothetical protein BJ508DRAFT_364476 [Ascobolus immersus RN42]|uniref:Cyanovirin-N domain-containing protein n=1 Tax=Ascobolus immersus RN42 TaxID=1160509 RepID=A0A3N4HW09_ASCIM|nr:hypothetical protein BJ508DRAFT_364476 [Ascobolus immersus RN42]